ncbi:MAG: hypothetical protein LBR36_04650, partial [Bacteroidales bacterium]|nr:hypothetical protein [Bacteroidales bacterium]
MNFQQPYNRQAWQTELQNIFCSQVQFEAQPENVVLNLQNSPAKSIQRFASIKLADGKNLAVLDIAVAENVKIAKNRVGLRELVAQFIDHARYHGILAFYHCRDAACHVSTGEYRLSFISSEPTIDAQTGEFSIEQTAPKRFTYLLGENVPCRTFSDRMQKIAEKRGNIALDDVKDAFAVETLTKEFYAELSNWYFWALQNVQFPQGDNEVSVIRLITRLMFVWFIKQKHLPTRHCGLDPQSPQSLIPNEIFEKETLEKLLNYKDKT